MSTLTGPTAREIAEEIGNTGMLKRKSKVVAFVDLPGVPAGTPGMVTLVNGWDTWIRYRVLFDNRVDLGAIDREKLAPRKQYDDLVAKRDAALASGVFDRAEASGGDAEDDGAGAAAAESAGVTINGVFVAQSWLDKAKAARERLGAA